MKITSFNSRGLRLRGKEKDRHLRDIIRKEEIDVACIKRLSWQL